MPSRPNASKRKATVSVKDQASSKTARPGISSDAPTSKRQGESHFNPYFTYGLTLLPSSL
jgi:hypothetical protein